MSGKVVLEYKRYLVVFRKEGVLASQVETPCFCSIVRGEEVVQGMPDGCRKSDVSLEYYDAGKVF